MFFDTKTAIKRNLRQIKRILRVDLRNTVTNSDTFCAKIIMSKGKVMPAKFTFFI